MAHPLATVAVGADSLRSTLVHGSEEHGSGSDPDQLFGRIGRVTVPIPADGPGEISVAIRGGRSALPHGAKPRSRRQGISIFETCARASQRGNGPLRNANAVPADDTSADDADLDR
jgi:hypothetical protein